jgi:hypothetical protein
MICYDVEKPGIWMVRVLLRWHYLSSVHVPGKLVFEGDTRSSKRISPTMRPMGKNN